MMAWLKREIEEKTDDYKARMNTLMAAEAERRQKREDRKAAAEAKATALAPAFLAELQEAERQRESEFSFSCSRRGDFLTVWHNGKGHTVNLAYVSTVDFTAGHAVTADGGGFYWYRDHDDPEIKWGRPPDSFGHGRWPYEEVWRGYPEASTSASVEFKGVGLSLSAPHAKGREMYEAILKAIEYPTP